MITKVRFTMLLRPTMLLGLCLGLMVAAGCGSSGPEMSRVSGKVTYKGVPVTKGLVTFQSTTGGRNATGQIQPDGSYKLQTIETNDGALVGDYTVTIASREDEQVLDYIPKKAPEVKRLTPEKYESPTTSGLKATVKSGSNTCNFDLVD